MKNNEGFAHLALAAVLAVVLVGGATTTVAANNSKPGDALYSIDRSTENIRGFFAFSDKAKANFKLEQASERLEELEGLQNKGASAELINEASDNYGQSISEAAQAVAAAAKSGEGFDEAKANLIAEATTIHFTVLADVLERVPDGAKASIEKAIENSERGAEQALDALNGQVGQEKMDQARNRIEESRANRGGNSSGDAADNAENGRDNIPEEAGPPADR
jgi:hypothetical protein